MRPPSLQAALSPLDEPLVILAGAGSGKTSTMVSRMQHMLALGVKAEHIVALTFSTSAASEMMSRLKALGPCSTSRREGPNEKDPEGSKSSCSAQISVSTFHSFCLQICREFGLKGDSNKNKAGLQESHDFTLVLEKQQRRYIASALCGWYASQSDLKEPGEKEMKDKVGKLLKALQVAKAAGRAMKGDGPEETVYLEYQKALAEQRGLDFTDLVLRAREILETEDDAVKVLEERHRFILVDEFQDTSESQLAFIRILASGGRLTVVGDDDQSIYGFQGANPLNFNTLKMAFPKMQQVRLESNFRSTANIVRLAAGVISHNSVRQL